MNRLRRAVPRAGGLSAQNALDLHDKFFGMPRHQTQDELTFVPTFVVSGTADRTLCHATATLNGIADVEQLDDWMSGQLDDWLHCELDS